MIEKIGALSVNADSVPAITFQTKTRRFLPQETPRFCFRIGLGLRINRWLYCSRPQAHSEAPPGDVFCTHIACFHIPTWGFARKNALFFKKLNLPTGFRIASYFSKMHNIKAASFTVSTIILT